MFKSFKFLKRGLKQVSLSRGFSSSFLNGQNSNYVEEMYKEWVKDPALVHVSWRTYFDNLSRGADPNQIFVSPSELRGRDLSRLASSQRDTSRIPIQVMNSVSFMVKQFRTHGHFYTDLDPLNLDINKPQPFKDSEFYDLDETKIPKEFYDVSFQYEGFLKHGFYQKKQMWTAREIHSRLKEIYCGKIGFEFMKIPSKEIQIWLR